MVRITPSYPPGHLIDLDDFLWRDFDSTSAWAQWVDDRYDVGVRVARREFTSASTLQAALRRLQLVNAGAPPDAGAARDVQRIATTHHVSPTVHGDGTTELGAPSSPVADLVVAALNAMNDGTWVRFKRCRNARCTASFFDKTKNGTRIWCSMSQCGAREKMRRFRAEQHTDRSPRESQE